MLLILFLVSILFLSILLTVKLMEKKNLKVIPGLSLSQIINLATSKSSADASHKLSKLHDILGPVFKIHIKPFKPFIFTSKAEHVEEILMSKANFEKTHLMQLFASYVGQGLVTVHSAHEWKFDRKLINRAMGHNFLNNILSKTESNINEFCDSLKNQLPNMPIDIQTHMQDVLLKVILETISASSIRHEWNLVKDYSKARSRYVDLVMERMMSIYLIPNIVHMFSKNYSQSQKVVKVLITFAEDLLRQHKLIPETIKDNNNFIQVLIDGGMSDDRIVDNISTIIETGHDTTASATSWMLYELSRNMVVQENILQEIIEILGSDPQKEITLKDIQGMKYVDRFVAEILRVYTIFNFLGRKLGKSVNINGIELPEGSTIFYTSHGIHMSKEYYDNPTKFDPDRFLPENGKKLNPNAYVAFSVGFRNCIAKTIAVQQLKLIVAKLVRSFEINPYDHEMDVDPVPVRKSRNGVFVILTHRNMIHGKN